MNRFNACRVAEKRDLMYTVNLTNRPRAIYSSQGNFTSPNMRTFDEDLKYSSRMSQKSYPKTHTFGTVLLNSKQERRLLNHDKTLKIWEKRTELLSGKCKRASMETLMERSDLHAIKMQELIELSKISNPCENTDAYYQWMNNLREDKVHDKNRRIFLPLSSPNSINS
jgi:hypothetical protein